jgi:hypothetical protein
MPEAKLTALVLGGADTLHADKAAALSMFEPDLIIACNHAGRDEPGRLDHWATMHADLMPHWLGQRRAAGRPEPGQLWHARHRGRLAIESSRSIESWGGSSGLLCVAVAYELGATRIALAGVPMSKVFHHYDDPKQWLEARQYWPAWEQRKHIMLGRVRSFSGWTANLLGVPTKEWLHGGE